VVVSVLDQFRDAEQRVAQRLKELEPAVAEYRELETIAERLGIDSTTTAKPGAATPPARPRRRASRAPAKSARGGAKTTSAAKKARPRARRGAAGEREQQLLELVRERPGITVAEAGKTLGVDPTGLYRVVHRLEQRGDVVKNGRKLEPAPVASAR
jgi:transcriptional regulator with GAF, ATPase, and Fis domain